MKSHHTSYFCGPANGHINSTLSLTSKLIERGHDISYVTSENFAQKIKELNGGNPWTSKEVAQAVNVGIGNTFYYYTASSRDFGFTIGTRDTAQISLTQLGREIVYAPNPNVEREKKIEAFLKLSD